MKYRIMLEIPSTGWKEKVEYNDGGFISGDRTEDIQSEFKKWAESVGYYNEIADDSLESGIAFNTKLGYATLLPAETEDELIDISIPEFNRYVDKLKAIKDKKRISFIVQGKEIKKQVKIIKLFAGKNSLFPYVLLKKEDGKLNLVYKDNDCYIPRILEAKILEITEGSYIYIPLDELCAVVDDFKAKENILVSIEVVKGEYRLCFYKENTGYTEESGDDEWIFCNQIGDKKYIPDRKQELYIYRNLIGIDYEEKEKTLKNRRMKLKKSTDILIPTSFEELTKAIALKIDNFSVDLGLFEEIVSKAKFLEKKEVDIRDIIRNYLFIKIENDQLTISFTDGHIAHTEKYIGFLKNTGDVNFVFPYRELKKIMTAFRDEESAMLNISIDCEVVEFQCGNSIAIFNGINLRNHPYPVNYLNGLYQAKNKKESFTFDINPEEWQDVFVHWKEEYIKNQWELIKKEYESMVETYTELALWGDYRHQELLTSAIKNPPKEKETWQHIMYIRYIQFSLDESFQDKIQVNFVTCRINKDVNFTDKVSYSVQLPVNSAECDRDGKFNSKSIKSVAVDYDKFLCFLSLFKGKDTVSLSFTENISGHIICCDKSIYEDSIALLMPIRIN